MTEQEKGILEATKEFAEIHNIPYDDRIESMILNAMREVVKNCSIPSVSKRYQVTDIQLADWESVAIGDTKTNKVICHFITENGFDEAVDTAKKITKFLNGC